MNELEVQEETTTEIVAFPRNELFNWLGGVALPKDDTDCAPIAQALIEWVDAHDLIKNPTRSTPLGVSPMLGQTRNGRQLYAALGEMVPPGWEFNNFDSAATTWPVRNNPPSPVYGQIYICRPSEELT